MRSSKSRSRSKQNRPRSIGNIVNRVFDSSGPEGKVRGTPQQIIEKYQTLARDAQLSNDRVAAENFLQHAEHYTRMLGEAMRELAAEQESRRQNQGGNGNGNGNGQHGGQDRQGYGQRRDDRDEEQPEVVAPAFGYGDGQEEGDFGLVETPEARSEQPQRHEQKPRNERRQPQEQQPRRERDERRRDDRRRDERRPVEVTETPDPLPVAEAPSAPQPVALAPEQPELPAFVPATPPEAVAAAAPSEKPKRPRVPRKPKVETDSSPETAS